MPKIFLKFIFILILLSCNSVAEKDNPEHKEFTPTEEFADYWWSGKAEVSSYNLNQARYGQIHQGSAVLIFVTEDFSKSKHLKLDDPNAAGDDAANVMKVNFTKKFNTGIYPYSMMMSSFKPVEVANLPRALKATATSQEWCGHTFTQLDLEGNQYNGHLYSYFESEGSENDFNLKATLLEDEVWNTIRLDYQLLPTGSIKIIPGLLSQRLMHSNFEVMQATASLNIQSDSTMAYQIDYQKPARTLKIIFANSFPYRILGWEDTHHSRGELLTTKATLNKSLKIDYWNKNSLDDATYRNQLELE